MMTARWPGSRLLDVVPEHEVQGTGQAEVLVGVLGAVGQPAERVVYLAVGELDQVECVGDDGDPGGDGRPVGGRQVHGQVPQRAFMAFEQAFPCLAGAFLGQAEGAAGAEVDQVGEPLRAGLAVAGAGPGMPRRNSSIPAASTGS